MWAGWPGWGVGGECCISCICLGLYYIQKQMGKGTPGGRKGNPRREAERLHRLAFVCGSESMRTVTPARAAVDRPSRPPMQGFVFAEYDTPQQAQAARAALDGYQLDKAHKFAGDWGGVGYRGRHHGCAHAALKGY